MKHILLVLLGFVLRFQEVTGTLTLGGRSVPLREVRLSGATFMFRYAAGWRISRAFATVTGGRLSGTIQRGWTGRAEPWSAERR